MLTLSRSELYVEVNSLPVIEVKGLTKVFGRNTKEALALLKEGKSKEEILNATGCTVAVNNVTFSVERGEFFVIMGLSGSGKSTLIRLINRLIEPTSGSILIDGKDISNLDKKDLRDVRREKLSMVFQSFALFPHRTILENAEFGLEIQKINRDERRKKAVEALEMVGLGDYVEQYPEQLSGGMQQRVGLARALTNDPEVLLMDEAFSALDPLIRKDMQDELIDLQAKMKKTILFITHDLDEALRLGDRIALMRDGEIVQIGTPEEILMKPANEYVEKFVEDVDRSKVLTAKHVMKRPETVNIDRHGPRVALERMRQEGISSILVVDNNRKLQGYVIADDVLDARNRGEKDLRGVLQTDIQQVELDQPMHDIFNMIYDTKVPVAVVENERLVGILVRGSVIAGLASEGEVNGYE